MSQEVVYAEESTVALLLPGRAGAVEGDFTVYFERFVSATLTSTDISATTTITESATAPGTFYVSWTYSTESNGGAVILKHTASGDCAAAAVFPTKRKTRIRNTEAATYPTIDSFDGTTRTLKDPDNSATTYATYTRSGTTTITWTR